MSSWAVPGVQVACVDASPHRLMGSPSLVMDAIYEIEDAFDWLGTPAIVLRGHPSGHPTGAYRLERFRPLTKSTKTQEEDMAMFWDILAEEGEKV